MCLTIEITKCVFFFPICIRPEVAIYLFDVKVKHNVIINNQNILCHLKNNNTVFLFYI